MTRRPTTDLTAQADRPQRDHRGYLAFVGLVIAGILIGAYTLPPLFMVTKTSLWELDPSWQLSLGMALIDHLHFGTQYLWTYGPLGFTKNSLVWPSPELTNAAAAIDVALHLAYVISFLIFAELMRRSFPTGRVEGALLLGATAFAAFWSGIGADTGDVVVMLSLMTAILCFEFWLSRAMLFLAFGTGALLAVGALYKDDLIWVAVAQLLVFSVILVTRPLACRAIWVAWAGLTLVFLAGWLATGQDVHDLSGFFVGAWSMSSGYSADMSLGFQALPLAALGLTVLIAIVFPIRVMLKSHRWSRQTATIALAAPFLFITWKEGVVRVTAFYSGRSLALLLTLLGLAWLVMATSPRLFCRPTLAPVAAAAACVAVMFGSFGWFIAEPSVLSRLHSVDIGPSVHLPGFDYVPKRDLNLLRGHTVAAIPWDVNLIVDNHLRWDTLPVPQTYQAYTTYLDQLEAHQLASRTGASRLVVSFTAIDGRYELWDPPLLWQALLTHYSCEATTGISAILRRSSTYHAVAEYPIGTALTTFGKWVAIPQTGLPYESTKIQVVSSLAGMVVGFLLRQAAVEVQFRLSNGIVTSPFRFMATDAMDGEYISRYVGDPQDLCAVLSRTPSGVPRIMAMRFETTAVGEWQGLIRVQFLAGAEA